MFRRIKEIRKALNINQTQFAKRLGISQSTLAMIEVGKRNFGERHIKVICAEFGVREEWIRSGKGEMFAASISGADAEKRKFLQIYDKLSDNLKDYLYKSAFELLKIQEGGEDAPGANASENSK